MKIIVKLSYDTISPGEKVECELTEFGVVAPVSPTNRWYTSWEEMAKIERAFAANGWHKNYSTWLNRQQPYVKG